MHGRPTHDTSTDVHASHPERWRILGVLVIALLVTTIDHTIINVALPKLVSDLGATAAQLQWVVAAYTIVFAGLLLTAGSMGDRFGRRHALILGLATFAAGSVVAATAGSTSVLIASRAVMGVGGALIMPTTLSILVNAFGDPRERAKAIAVWTAVTGAGIAFGPIAGGALMRSFSWSSVFWINVPFLAIALAGALHVVPDSRDPHATRLDPAGATVSMLAVGALVYAIIEAPGRGWTSSASLVAFAAGLVGLVLFVAIEVRREEPMLDVRLFRNRGFSAGSIGLALLFFAMAGTVFLQAQYLQFILDYTPLAAGFALVPAAIGVLIGSGAGAHLAKVLSGRAFVTAGTLLAGAGIVVQAAFSDGSSYLPTGIGLLLFGLGAGLAMPAATELIMATLPPARAGVGSAVNDTVRELGGALGVAVIGSVAATRYTSSLAGELDRIPGIGAAQRRVLTDNVGAALATSKSLGADATRVAAAARQAFIDSMTSSLWVAAGLALGAAIVAALWLPRVRAAGSGEGTGHGGSFGHGHASGHGHSFGHGHGHGPVHEVPAPVASLAAPLATTSPTPPAIATPTHGHIGRIVTGCVLGGLATAVFLVTVPFAGAPEHVITGSVLVAFGAAWTALAWLSARRTDQPQRWAVVPAVAMGAAGVTVLAAAPTGNEAGWIWPPAVAALAVWMTVRARASLRSRTRAVLLYPVFASLVLASAGGALETYRESTDSSALSMPGRLVDVGGRSLHLDCRGTGSPTVVLEPGLGETANAMAWVRADVARTTRVCVYDRAGRGWSDAAGRALDGAQTATDLHTLLQRAGEHGPFVLAGHSAGGLYVLNFAHLYPASVAGVVLLDSMSPQQYERIASWPAFYESFRRASALLPSLSRIGLVRAFAPMSYRDLPPADRRVARAFSARSRDNRSVRDEFSRIRTAMRQAASLHDLRGRPLVVVTAEKDASGGWADAQDDLAGLSSNSDHVRLPGASHGMLTEDRATARRSAHAVARVVTAVRTGAPIAEVR